MPAVRGKDNFFYVNTDDPYDNTPTFELYSNVKDLTLNLEKALADASTRASSYRQQVGTLKDLSIDFQSVYDPTDDIQEQLDSAFHSDDDVEVLFLDGPISTIGSKGIRFMSQVTKFARNEALEDITLIDITIVPAYSQTNAPRRVHVASPGSVIDS